MSSRIKNYCGKPIIRDHKFTDISFDSNKIYMAWGTIADTKYSLEISPLLTKNKPLRRIM